MTTRKRLRDMRGESQEEKEGESEVSREEQLLPPVKVGYMKFAMYNVNFSVKVSYVKLTG